MKLRVTKQHIRQGRPGTAGECPIEYALQEKYGVNAFQTEVGIDTIELKDVEIKLDGGATMFGTVSIPTPRRAARFVERFDRGERVHPMSINLPLPRRQRISA